MADRKTACGRGLWATKPRDVVRSVTAGAFAGLAVYGLWVVVGGYGALIGLAAVTVTSLVLSLTLAHRSVSALVTKEQQRTRLTIAKESRNLYRQIEALLSVRSELGISRALPPMRGWAISPDFAELVLDKLREKDPDWILECGSGVSSLVIGAFLKKRGRGRLLSLEHDERYAAMWRNRIRDYGLEEHVTIVHAPLTTYEIKNDPHLWYDIKSMERTDQFEFVVIDGPPEVRGEMRRMPLLDLLGGNLAKGALVLLDDANRPDEQRTLAYWMDNHLCADYEMVETEKGAAIVQVAT